MNWYQQKQGSKYHNVRQTYNNYSYASKRESAYAQELDLRVKAKDIKSWRRQEKIELSAYGEHITNYFCDFLIIHNDKTKEYVEIKSPITMTETWRLKWKMSNAKMAKDISKGKVKMVVLT